MDQIILITDGCSNVGISPVVAAAQAQTEGIVVNVIGIVDDTNMGEVGIMEITEIARAGGGMSRTVNRSQLSKTMQMMTRQTVVQTIQQAVGHELQQIFGHSRLEELPLASRSKVVDVMDQLSESTDLRVVLLIDCSASMGPKLPYVKEAARDLLLSLQSRSGQSFMSVFHFPGQTGEDEDAVMDAGWTSELERINELFYQLNMKGTTPTGPALLKCVRYIRHNEGGLLSDYVVS